MGGIERKGVEDEEEEADKDTGGVESDEEETGEK